MAEGTTPKKRAAEGQEEPEKVAREAVAEADPPEDAPSFPVERLLSDAYALVGVEPHVLAGALHGVNRKNLTVEEAKAAVAAWLKSPVKED